MKNKVGKPGTIAVVFIALSLSCFSQKSFSLGVKGGIDIPNLAPGGKYKDDPLSRGWTSRLGPYFGMVGIYEISKKFALQAEFNYSSQGAKKNGKQAIPTADFEGAPAGLPQYVYANIKAEAKLNYLELPIMAKFSMSIGGNWYAFINAGPYFGYLLAAKDYIKGTTNVYLDEAEQVPLFTQDITVDDSEDIKDQVKKFNMGLQGGVGLTFKLPTGALMLSIGGNYGLIPIQKDKTNGQNITGAANVTLGYLFRF